MWEAEQGRVCGSHKSGWKLVFIHAVIQSIKYFPPAVHCSRSWGDAQGKFPVLVFIFQGIKPVTGETIRKAGESLHFLSFQGFKQRRPKAGGLLAVLTCVALPPAAKVLCVLIQSSVPTAKIICWILRGLVQDLVWDEDFFFYYHNKENCLNIAFHAI